MGNQKRDINLLGQKMGSRIEKKDTGKGYVISQEK
jgi:hypothetical protein